MHVDVRKNNVAKAMSILNKKITEDGDFRRHIDKQHFVSKGQKRRAAMAAAKMRNRKDIQERIEQDEFQNEI